MNVQSCRVLCSAVMLATISVADLPSCRGLTNAQHERCRPSSPLAVSFITPWGCGDRASRRYSCHQSCSFALKPVDASVSRRPSASVWLVSAALSTGVGSAGATCTCHNGAWNSHVTWIVDGTLCVVHMWVLSSCRHLPCVATLLCLGEYVPCMYHVCCRGVH